MPAVPLVAAPINLVWSSNHEVFLFFIDPPNTEIYTLSLHDALPILDREMAISLGKRVALWDLVLFGIIGVAISLEIGRARLNSSHANISYAVFCLKKKTSTQDDEESNPDQHRPEGSARSGHDIRRAG